MVVSPLDEAVDAALADLALADAPTPSVVALLGTGTGLLTGRIERHGKIALASIAGVPEPWSHLELHHGALPDGGGANVWMLDDVSGDEPPDRSTWRLAFPCWLAAAAGARVLLHTSAGSALPCDGAPRRETLALLCDHVNLSGHTPLAGLGETRLGPLFPDLSRLHHRGLREAARRRAEAIGVDTSEAVAACTLGPTRDTPAERRFLAAGGCGVAVQGLATPLLAAAHAGLAALAVVAVTDDGSEAMDLGAIVEASAARGAGGRGPRGRARAGPRAGGGGARRRARGGRRMSDAIAVFCSGGGRSLENLLRRHADGELPHPVGLVVSERDGIGALARAERHGVPSLVIPWADCGGPEGFAERAFAAVEERGCELVVLAGFLKFLHVPAAWKGRVINVHPSLLPAFGGKGYYGDRVHTAVLERGAWFTGCTVHYVDDEYDHGPILLQRCVRVEPGDTVDGLAARVFDEERIALPAAIRRHFERR